MRDYSSCFAAYGFAAVVVGFIVVKITLDYRELKAKLARFDHQDEEVMSATDEAPVRLRNWKTALPLLGFLALAGLFVLRLQSGGDPSVLPSPLIGQRRRPSIFPPCRISTVPACPAPISPRARPRS